MIPHRSSRPYVPVWTYLDVDAICFGTCVQKWLQISKVINTPWVVACGARIYARNQSDQNSGNDKIHAAFELVLTACEKELLNVSIVSGVRVMLP
jgi:hypothetical protein